MAGFRADPRAGGWAAAFGAVQTTARTTATICALLVLMLFMRA